MFAAKFLLAHAAPPDFEVSLEQIQLFGIAVLVLLVLIVLWRIVAPRKKQATTRKTIQQIDLSQLGEHGPSAEQARLECYHVPVRLALVVMAPLGRDSKLNVDAGLAHVLDQIVHGLGEVVETHKPLFRLWGPQLSANGFTTAFFSGAKLPGQKGKGTAWCALAGRCEVNGRNLMVGLVLRAEKPNNLGQVLLDQEYAWPDVLRPKPT